MSTYLNVSAVMPPLVRVPLRPREWLWLRASNPAVQAWAAGLTPRFVRVTAMRALDESFRRFEIECITLHGRTQSGECRTYHTVLHTPPFDPAWLAAR